jgi:uncharacterized protein YuzE
MGRGFNMYKRKTALYFVIVFLYIWLLIPAFSSCGSIWTDKQEKPDELLTQADTKVRSSFLVKMDDLKAINLAANYLKESGETVSFKETYIEYHDAGKTAETIQLAGGNFIEYEGDYLEIRFYKGEGEEVSPDDECIVVYIGEDGKILGQNIIGD